MAKRRQTSKRHSLRRGKKHALSTNVVSSRIIFLALIRRAKHFLIYTLVTCLLVLFCWGIFYSARKLVMEGDRFQLEAIQISPPPHENSFFTYQNLPEITGISISDSIFAHNLGEIEKRLTDYPELIKATLTREFPGTIKVSLVERVPIAKLIHKGETYLIDHSGYCFQSRFAAPQLTKRLPILQARHQHDLSFNVRCSADHALMIGSYSGNRLPVLQRFAIATDGGVSRSTDDTLAHLLLETVHHRGHGNERRYA